MDEALGIGKATVRKQVVEVEMRREIEHPGDRLLYVTQQRN